MENSPSNPLAFIRKRRCIYLCCEHWTLFLIPKALLSIKPDQEMDYSGRFILPVLYFALGLYLLNTYGEGGMVSRFEPYLLEGENGILSVLKNLILHPTYVFSKLLIAKKLGSYSSF